MCPVIMNLHVVGFVSDKAHSDLFRHALLEPNQAPHSS